MVKKEVEQRGFISREDVEKYLRKSCVVLKGDGSYQYDTVDMTFIQFLSVQYSVYQHIVHEYSYVRKARNGMMKVPIFTELRRDQRGEFS